MQNQQKAKKEDTNKTTMRRADANLVLRAFSIELLRQILLADAELIASCDGAFQILWDAVLQFEHRKLQCPLLLTILHTVGSSRGDFEIPALRSMLWPLTTVESPKTKVQIERARVMSSAAVQLMMRSWAGIWHLSSDPLALSEVVRVIGRRVPVAMRMCSLSIFESLIEHVDVDLEGQSADDIRPDLMHSYGAALLLALLHCGLTRQLVTVVLRSGETIQTEEEDEELFNVRAKVRW